MSTIATSDPPRNSDRTHRIPNAVKYDMSNYVEEQEQDVAVPDESRTVSLRLNEETDIGDKARRRHISWYTVGSRAASQRTGLSTKLVTAMLQNLM